MANPIDLCQLADVRSWLNINAQQDAMVNTTSTTSISAGLQQTVTPAVPSGIGAGCILLVGFPGSSEIVVVSSVDLGGTFEADFGMGHAVNAPIIDVTDQILGRLITANSVTIHRKIGRLNKDGSIPTASTLVGVQAFSDWYDGNGNSRMFLRNNPIQTVTTLTINNITVPQSTGPTTPGWVIDDTGCSIALRTSLVGIPVGWQHRGILTANLSVWHFARGLQNVNVQYTAGFASTPDDIEDACIELVALCYKRRNWIDQTTNTKGDDVGSVRYRDWEYPPRVAEVIADYRRRWAA